MVPRSNIVYIAHFTIGTCAKRFDGVRQQKLPLSDFGSYCNVEESEQEKR